MSEVVLLFPLNVKEEEESFIVTHHQFVRVVPSQKRKNRNKNSLSLNKNGARTSEE
jgi:hypothetical protein